MIGFSRHLVRICNPVARRQPNIRLMCEQKLPRPEGVGTKGSSREDPVKGKGPVSWRSVLVVGGVVGVCVGTYQYLKEQKKAQLEKDRKREIGKSMIGGPFNLIDYDGNPKSDKDFLGKWILLYFGFTHCPDVCPDEMEKMALVYDNLKAEKKSTKFIGDAVPIFITVDPERDTTKAIKEYVTEFHPEIVGLTGTEAQIKEACKSYRVYFSAGPRDDEDDYIVDHTIIIYLIDPEGNFVDYYGQKKTAKELTESIKLHMIKFGSKNKI